MNAVSAQLPEAPPAAAPIDLDVCLRCHGVWFDGTELSRLPLPPVEPVPEPLPQAAREQLALFEARRIAERAQNDGDPPDDDLQRMLGYFGLPIEENAPPVYRMPWVTLGTAGLMAVVFVAQCLTGPDIIHHWGLIPDQAGRHHGLTWFTSFFLHADLLHLIGNAYFLVAAGDNLEDFLGHVRFASLLVLSDVVGNLLHILWGGAPSAPAIGASGGISGLLACYALCFPHVRLVFNFRWLWWFRLPAWGAFVLWTGLQLLPLLVHDTDESPVAVLAHLGGALVGVAAFFALRRDLPAYLAPAENHPPDA